ncbi:MAG TPA: hypothetical protein PK748_13955, partial [Acidimicrobiales bacterium]|nr:hypothetical protein [Acidimicrobiales bacterium]
MRLTHQAAVPVIERRQPERAAVGFGACHGQADHPGVVGADQHLVTAVVPDPGHRTRRVPIER